MRLLKRADIASPDRIESSFDVKDSQVSRVRVCVQDPAHSISLLKQLYRSYY